MFSSHHLACGCSLSLCSPASFQAIRWCGSSPSVILHLSPHCLCLMREQSRKSAACKSVHPPLHVPASLLLSWFVDSGRALCSAQLTTSRLTLCLSHQKVPYCATYCIAPLCMFVRVTCVTLTVVSEVQGELLSVTGLIGGFQIIFKN